MTLILFLVSLAALILVHELGHFAVAKSFGIRVDEFGLGFPPRLFAKKVGETLYSLNLIPFGGFVKIFGENPSEGETESVGTRSFSGKNRAIQAAVLSAGVFGNIVFAWLLVSLGWSIGMPVPALDVSRGELRDPRLVIVSVLPETPAFLAGFSAGDVVRGVRAGEVESGSLTAEGVRSFVRAHEGVPLQITYERQGVRYDRDVVPTEGVAGGDGAAIGVALEDIGTVKLPIFPALLEGARTTGEVLILIISALFEFLWSALAGTASFDALTGPVGIAGMVGEAGALGVVHLLSFVAFISLNLAVINFLPVPALDGGRLLFVAIEAVTRRSLPVRAVNIANTIGFSLLVALMLLVTYRDIVKLL